MKEFLLSAAILVAVLAASSESANAQRRHGPRRVYRPVVVAPYYGIAPYSYGPRATYYAPYSYGYYAPSQFAYGYRYYPAGVYYPRPVYGYGYYGSGISFSVGF